jgi:hypothetical protein
MTFAKAPQVIVEMARFFAIRPSRYDGGDRLPHADFERMETILLQTGLNWRQGPSTEETLAALRATDEPLLDGLANALLLLPCQDGSPAVDATD